MGNEKRTGYILQGRGVTHARIKANFSQAENIEDLLMMTTATVISYLGNKYLLGISNVRDSLSTLVNVVANKAIK